MQVLLGSFQRRQLLVVLIEAHAARAVAVLVRQFQSLLVEAVVDTVLLIRQPTLSVTLAKAGSRP
ncbi:hypothetical protein D3C72_2422170 [compost metagenome]